jgi:hypothetical protein
MNFDELRWARMKPNDHRGFVGSATGTGVTEESVARTVVGVCAFVATAFTLLSESSIVSAQVDTAAQPRRLLTLRAACAT